MWISIFIYNDRKNKKLIELNIFMIVAGAVSAESIEKNLGPGGKAGEVPSDIEQATGLERLELLSKLEGKEFFDMEPLDMTHIGTVQNPIVVKSHDQIRFVGCTGKYYIFIIILRKKKKKKKEGRDKEFIYINM